MQVFNIKPYQNESQTRPHVKHRISSTTSLSTSQVVSGTGSGTDTPVIGVVGPNGSILQAGVTGSLPLQRTLDELADSAARKCLHYYGPHNSPRLSIGPRNQVTVDAAGKIHLIDDLEEYKKTVRKGTWNCVIKLADELREKKIKIGFFSSTPQGGKLSKCPSTFQIYNN